MINFVVSFFVDFLKEEMHVLDVNHSKKQTTQNARLILLLILIFVLAKVVLLANMSTCSRLVAILAVKPVSFY